MAFSHQKFTFLILCFITSLIVHEAQRLNSKGSNGIPGGPPKDLTGGGKFENGRGIE